VSRAVAALEADGLIARAQALDDRRTERLCLTDAGRTLYAQLAGEAERFDRALRAALGPAEAARFEAALRTLASDN
jgi:DNA-binding MarR family transcriptional regulator